MSTLQWNMDLMMGSLQLQPSCGVNTTFQHRVVLNKIWVHYSDSQKHLRNTCGSPNLAYSLVWYITSTCTVDLFATFSKLWAQKTTPNKFTETWRSQSLKLSAIVRLYAMKCENQSTNPDKSRPESLDWVMACKKIDHTLCRQLTRASPWYEVV